MAAEPQLRAAWVAPELEAEFPDLGLAYVRIEGRSGRSGGHVRQRLKDLSNRYTGGKAVQVRQEPIPWAYRVFFRQVGIDPDERRTPPEEVALERMRAGGFHSRSLLDDALLIATIETGVALMALDADEVEGALGLRLSHDRERLGGDGHPLSVRQIVVADDARSLAVLFGDMAEGRGVSPSTTRMLIGGVRVAGVPEVSLEEALWTAADVLAEG